MVSSVQNNNGDADNYMLIIAMVYPQINASGEENLFKSDGQKWDAY